MNAIKKVESNVGGFPGLVREADAEHRITTWSDPDTGARLVIGGCSPEMADAMLVRGFASKIRRGDER